MVRTAIQNGINFFDLCAGGKNVYEPFGRAITGQREKVFFQLHFGAVYNERANTAGPGSGRHQRNLCLELKALGTDYVDFGFLHCVDEDEDLTN